MEKCKVFFQCHEKSSLRFSLLLALSITVHVALVLAFKENKNAVVLVAPNNFIEVQLLSKKLQVASGAYDTPPISHKTSSTKTLEQSHRATADSESSSFESTNRQSGDVPLPIDPNFYTWREVDAPAILQGDAIPRIPPSATGIGAQTTVVVEVWINEFGRVIDVKTQGSTLPKSIEEEISAYYLGARFTPALREGKPKRFQARYVIQFS